MRDEKCCLFSLPKDDTRSQEHFNALKKQTDFRRSECHKKDIIKVTAHIILLMTRDEAEYHIKIFNMENNALGEIQGLVFIPVKDFLRRKKKNYIWKATGYQREDYQFETFWGYSKLFQNINYRRFLKSHQDLYLTIILERSSEAIKRALKYSRDRLGFVRGKVNNHLGELDLDGALRETREEVELDSNHQFQKMEFLMEKDIVGKQGQIYCREKYYGLIY